MFAFTTRSASSKSATRKKEKSIDVSPHGEHSQAQTHGLGLLTKRGQLEAEENKVVLNCVRKDKGRRKEKKIWKKVSQCRRRPGYTHVCPSASRASCCATRATGRKTASILVYFGSLVLHMEMEYTILVAVEHRQLARAQLLFYRIRFIVARRREKYEMNGNLDTTCLDPRRRDSAGVKW